MSSLNPISRAGEALPDPDVAAALMALSRALDGSPSDQTIHGVQVLLEALAASSFVSVSHLRQEVA